MPHHSRALGTRLAGKMRPRQSTLLRRRSLSVGCLQGRGPRCVAPLTATICLANTCKLVVRDEKEPLWQLSIYKHGGRELTLQYLLAAGSVQYVPLIPSTERPGYGKSPLRSP